MGYILNKYYKLRYSIISRDGHVCMEGEPVTIIKKITEIPDYYLCSVSFFKNREEPILIETRLCGLVEITKDVYNNLIESVDRYVYNLWQSQYNIFTLKHTMEQDVITYPHAFGSVIGHKSNNVIMSLDMLQILSMKDIKERLNY